MIVIPLFADQFLNARLAEHHGIAYKINKGRVSEEAVTSAIKTVTEDRRYNSSADLRNIHNSSLFHFVY